MRVRVALRQDGSAEPESGKEGHDLAGSGAPARQEHRLRDQACDLAPAQISRGVRSEPEEARPVAETAGKALVVGGALVGWCEDQHRPNRCVTVQAWEEVPMVGLDVATETPPEHMVPALHAGAYDLDVEGGACPCLVPQRHGPVRHERQLVAGVSARPGRHPLAQQHLALEGFHGHVGAAAAGRRERHHEVGHDEVVFQRGVPPSVRGRRVGDLAGEQAECGGNDGRPAYRDHVEGPAGRRGRRALAIEDERDVEAIEVAVAPQPSEPLLHPAPADAREDKRTHMLGRKVPVFKHRRQNRPVAHRDRNRERMLGPHEPGGF